MEGVQSYFAWNDCSSKSEDFLSKQIIAIRKTLKSEEAKEKQIEEEGKGGTNGGKEGEIKEESRRGSEEESKEVNDKRNDKPRNLPQLYTLKGYLHAKLDELDEEENCFNAALGKCKKDNEGYKKVIYESLVHICTLKAEKKKNEGENYGPCDGEVFAMRAHSAAYMQNNDNAIEFYEKALKLKETPEWCFGLALALIHKSVGRKSKINTGKIESLYRHAIQLDESYRQS